MTDTGQLVGDAPLQRSDRCLMGRIDSTETARSNNNTWDEVGEAFIRELGYSRIILKLNAADRENREDIQAIFRTSLPEFLEQCLVCLYYYIPPRIS